MGGVNSIPPAPVSATWIKCIILGMFNEIYDWNGFSNLSSMQNGNGGSFQRIPVLLTIILTLFVY